MNQNRQFEVNSVSQAANAAVSALEWRGHVDELQWRAAPVAFVAYFSCVACVSCVKKTTQRPCVALGGSWA